MELRFILAAMLIAAIGIVAIWFLTRKARQRRKFRMRQQGRGKAVEHLPVK